MTSQDCVEQINQIEELFPVDTWKLGNIHIWPILRIMIYKKMMRPMYSPGENNPFCVVLKKRLQLFIEQKGQRILHLIYPDKSSTKKIEGKSEVLFYSFKVCRIFLNGVLYDKYCDPLTDTLRKSNIRVLHLEETYSITSDRLARQNGDICANFNTLFYNYLSSHKVPLPAEESLESYDEFLNYIKELLINISISEFTKQEIRKKVNKIIITKNLFEDILIKNGTKICFTVSYYHDSGMALCLACNKLGVKIVELQHGSQRHPAYSGWNKIPREGYDALPTLFWNWSKEDAEDINKWASKTGGKYRAFSGGYPWLSMWRKNSSTNNAKINLHAPDQNSTLKKIHILFSLNGSSDLPPEWVMDAIRNSPKNWIWIFRVHPNKTADADKIERSVGKYRLRGEFEMELSSTTPLPQSLVTIDVHVTGSSTVIMEAEMFGVPSVAIHEDGLSSYPEQAKRGVVVLAKDGGALIEKIKLQIEKRTSIKYIMPEDGNLTKNTLRCLLREVGISMTETD